MKILYHPALSLAIILNSSGFSLQFDCLPNGEPIPLVPRARPSSPDRHNSPERNISSSNPPVRARGRSLHARFMNQPTAIAAWNGIRYGFNQLELIRLVSYKNQNRLFQLRRYTFPPNFFTKLCIRHNNTYLPIPDFEYIVLSTRDREAFAILEVGNVFAGFYGGNGKRRMKINMVSGMVTPMIKKEIDEIPVGDLRPIVTHYRVELVSQNSLDSTFNQNEM